MPLVLSRKDGQTVRVGSSLVTVYREGNRTKLVIDAPEDIPIVRREIDDWTPPIGRKKAPQPCEYCTSDTPSVGDRYIPAYRVWVCGPCFADHHGPDPTLWTEEED